MNHVVVFSADTEVSSLLQTHFESRQYQTHVFPHFVDVHHIFAHYTPQILVFDLDLDHSDLVSFLQVLYAHESWGYVPRIFLQGTHLHSQFSGLEAQGHGPVLQKPIESHAFHTWLTHYLSTLPASSPALPPVAAADASPRVASTPASSLPFRVSGAGSTGSVSPVPETSPPASSVYHSGDEHPEPAHNKLFQSFLGRTIGSVLIEGELGQGGMGAVFSGRQTSLNRKVAVKIMLPELVGNTMAIERFRREALAIARLKSPHIVQVFDAGTTPDDIFYLVMEYLEGTTVTQHIKSYGRYPIPMALNIAFQVAQGLHVAHQAGLIHRDIKPSNLMIDKNLHVTITDFGLVRSFDVSTGDDQLTQAQSLLGTPVYLSPEQATGQVADARSDIYSLGIVLFRILVGQPPFLSDNMFQLLMMHHSTPLPDPRSYVPEIPNTVADILFKMTAKDPEMRYPHCTALLRDLHTALAGYNLAPEHPALLPTGAFPSFAAPKEPLPVTMIGIMDTPSVTPSSYGSSGVSLGSDLSLASAPIPEGELLPQSFVEQLQIELARYIGPIAKIALKEEAKRLGYSRKAFPLDRASDWLSLLASRVDATKRSVFLDAANKLLQSLNTQGTSR